jgi:hypothetical protein
MQQWVLELLAVELQGPGRLGQLQLAQLLGFSVFDSEALYLTFSHQSLLPRTLLEARN